MDIFSLLFLDKIYKQSLSDPEETFNLASNEVELDMTLLTWLNFQSKMFKNKYDLINGDKDFDNMSLQFLLNTMWWSGRVAVSKFNDKLELFTFVNEKSNYKGEVLSATGYHANFLYRPMEWSRIQNMTTFKLNKDNAVFCYYNSILFSGFIEALEFGVRYTRAWKVYDKNLLLAQKMLIFKTGQNMSANRSFLNSLKKVKLGISRMIRGSSFSKDSINQLIANQDTIETLEFTPNLKDLKNAIDNIKSEYNELYGNKTNLNFKRERQVVSELDLLDYHFEVLEKDTKNNIESILEQMNKMWNKNYQLKEVAEPEKEVQPETKPILQGDKNEEI